jgi:starch-binding outer membrane protein, SusD/RagB family
MKKNIIKLSLVLAFALPLSSCLKDLNQKPITELTSANVFENFTNYKGVLAKCYAGLATTGNQGPDGKPDIQDIDEGASSYLRILFNMQDLTTDAVKCQWGDPGVPALNTGEVSSDNGFNEAMYYRIFFQVSLCNEFLRELTDEKLSSRNITGAQLEEAKAYRAEARFLRALSYYHALDLYGGKVPFTTETSNTAELPKQTNASALFGYIESELKAIETELKAPKANDYGRADRAAAWMLLSKLYLNAGVYVGTPKYAEASTYSKKVIDANAYTLDENYANVFKADNHTSPEIIMSVNFDGVKTRTYGGTTFLVHACVGGKMNPADYGIGGGWAGMRTTPQFAEKFVNTLDSRGMLFTNGQTKDIPKLTGSFSGGYGLAKFSNLTKAGANGSDLLFVDTDFPLFRLSEAYLNYAESNIVGGAGDATLALQYINKVRNRAYNNDPIAAYISIADITADELLDERGREFYHECTRRTDLRRFNKFTGSNYTWSWKGGTQAGASLPSFREVFPLPVKDLTANSNLIQNAGY